MSQLIFANLLNELMIGLPESAYAKNLSQVTVRKIWLSHAGDILITPAPIHSDFKRYACSLINEPDDEIITLSPPGDINTYLAERLQMATEMYEES